MERLATRTNRNLVPVTPVYTAKWNGKQWVPDKEIRICWICGKDLINQPNSTEGGLVDRWSCPIHGTRGVTK
jgi:hypothetical protein